MTTRRRAGSGRDETSRLLLAIRAGRKQTDAAAVSGLTQSKISRAEQGKQPLSPGEAELYARSLGADPEVRERLVMLARATEDLSIVGRGALLRDAAKIQERVGLLEAAAAVVRSWMPEVVHGAFQTWDYTLAVIAPRVPDEEWTRRRRARTTVLDDESRTWHLLLSEAVLRWVIGSPEVMRGQIEHLAELSRRPNIRLGLLPLDTPLPVAMPSAFHLYGDRAAEVAVFNRTSFFTDRADLDGLRADFDQLAGVALYDDDARELLAQIARRYR